MPEKPPRLRDLLSRELPRLYAFAYSMCCDRAEALRYVTQLVRDAGAQGVEAVMAAGPVADVLLGMMARHMEDTLGRKAEQTFDKLDEILRSDITRPIVLDDSGEFESEDTPLMLWELKRTCLTATLGCLPPGVRLSFVLTDLLQYSPTRASELLSIKESAYRVRLTRARKRIEDYLTPRCHHVDRQNPCSCMGRLVIAMDAEFVVAPPHRDDIPADRRHDEDGPHRDIARLYRGLPRVKLTRAELEALLAGL
jgi:RNA polymerase sigma-70 factor (ECF subfamily)